MKKTNSRPRFASLYAAVKAYAQHLVAEHEGGPPYDPYHLAERLDVDVAEATLVGIDGYVEIKEGKYCVTISSKSHDVRKRFTLAHELCHVWLMRQAADGFPAPLIRYRNGKNIPGLHQDPVEESLCNYFASELLIPSEQLAHRFLGKTIVPKTVFTLARDYRVSRQTAGIKLTQVFKKQVVACSLWSLESLWPLPMWWSGSRPHDKEVTALEELVGRQAPALDMWKKYGKCRHPVVIDAQPSGNVSVVVIRRYNS